MDVSDGFVGDVTKMLRASGVSGEIAIDRLPLSVAATEAISHDPRLFEIAATGGDDYELIASVAADADEDFEDAARLAGVAVTKIGVAREGAAPPRFLRDGQVVRFRRGSFSHF
jgi:thiamine-monophosphate kinase